MKLTCGIVGLPNVGKSTIFSALTKAPASAENYPFCTIDPNVGVVDLPDERLDFMASVFQPKKKIPASVDFVDIAGLIKGASKGEGLGNQFLANIRETTVIAHVVRCFDNPDIQHVRDDAGDENGAAGGIGQKPSAKELMSISDLERLTGITFFANVRNAPKSTYNASDWGL